MFSLRARREEQALVSAHTSPNGTPNKKKKPTMRQRLSNLKDGKRFSASTQANYSSLASPPKQQQDSQEQQVAIAEHDGIEVSLETPSQESREPQEGSFEHATRKPILDVPELIRLREKVYKKQFSVDFPALQTTANTTNRKHRVPLSNTKAQETSFLDALHLLQISGPKDEYAAVSQELKCLTAELNALEQDKNALEQKHQSITTSNTTSLSSSDWDIHRMLTISNNTAKSETISMEERQTLQTKRGNNLTICISNNRARQTLLSKLGAKVQAKNAFTIGPHNCKKPTTKELQHLALLSAHQHSKPGVIHTSFVLSFDKSKTQTWGHLPLNLFRRIKYHDVYKTDDIAYLSSGPLGSYFCEFSNGESWWGSPIPDDDFFDILQEWPIHRVVFGPALSLEDERGNQVLSHSWIVMGKNGRLAWKNLPSKLHHILKARNGKLAGLAEASLGLGHAYFVKFLDGTMEYCLPAHMASTCQQIEQQGGTITNIMFHPEISKDFVIRHTGISGNL